MRRVIIGVVAALGALTTGCNDNRLGAARGPDISVNPGTLTYTAANFQGGGESASLTLIITNEGGAALKLENIEFATGTSTEFSWAFGGSSSLPMTLPPEGWVAVQVTYAPTDYAQDTGALLVHSTDPDEQTVTVPIVTPVLGPALACTPNPATFIQAPGNPTNRTITCTNSGTAPITVTGFEFAPGTSGEFTSSWTPTPQTLDAGDALSPFTVTYTPGALGADAGQILVHNDAGADYVIELTGEGTDQPLCDLSAFPFYVNFGTVLLGSNSTKQVLLSNSGSGVCHITSATIAALTTEYAYISNQTYTINPGGVQSVSVRYTPTDRITDIGALNIASDDPAEPELGIFLTGVGAGPEIDVLPCPVEFGLVTVGCKVDKQVTIYNTGDYALNITSATLGSGSNEFSILQQPPTSIPPNGTGTVSVRFAAANAGAETRILQINNNDGDEPVFQCQLEAEGTSNDHQVDSWIQSDEPQADILFVVDNSGSMSEEQQALANSFADFAAYLTQQNVAWQVGVTTTDVEPGGAQGQLVGNPKIITPATPNAAAKFAANANVGTDGSGTEQGLEGARLALTPPNVTGANAGFLRQAAKLFLIFVSDEEDQSPDGNGGQPAMYFANAYKNIKGNSPAMISASAIAGDVPNGCSTAAAGARYKEVVDDIGGVWSTICTNNFGPALHNIGVEAAELTSTFFLTRAPVVATIVVKVNGVVKPASTWTYSPGPNSVTFNSSNVPTAGQTITIEYDVVCEMP